MRAGDLVSAGIRGIHLKGALGAPVRPWGRCGVSSEDLFSSSSGENTFSSFLPLKPKGTLAEDAEKEAKPRRREKGTQEGPAEPRPPGTHVEAAVHGLSKPDVFLLLALTAPPVLPRHSRWVGVDASLAGLHVAENFHGVQGAALVGINPVVSCRRKRRHTMRARLPVRGKTAYWETS